MPFHESAEDIWLEDIPILHARLREGDGNWRDAEINLDTILGNDDGSFQWGGESFSSSASDIKLTMDSGAPILGAALLNRDNDSFWAEVDLSEFISNDNGEFVYIGEY